MAKTKKMKQMKELVPAAKTPLPLDEAVNILKQFNTRKFDQTVEISMRLGVDPKQADQIVRGSVVLPNGIGKSLRVLVFAKGEKAAEATEAGADFVGDADLAEKIKGGWTDVDVIICTPSVMAKVGVIGRILGPRGLMPNPKTGTV
ncbi:MAG: 50S ribosomal protein L1, partial [Thermoguttaceae bacterium]|nr:50S ribosomal protein L1 [Thermoguttaceae bacterium]